MSASDAFLSELRTLNNGWRIAKNDSKKSESDFPINKINLSENSSNEPIVISRPVSKYAFWDESQMEAYELFRENDEFQHQKPLTWSEMTKEQRSMKRKEWKVEDNFYHQRLPVDPIRIAFIDDWRNMKSGAEIWCPR